MRGRSRNEQTPEGAAPTMGIELTARAAVATQSCGRGVVVVEYDLGGVRRRSLDEDAEVAGVNRGLVRATSGWIRATCSRALRAIHPWRNRLILS
jgi:hypothetical protein